MRKWNDDYDIDESIWDILGKIILMNIGVTICELLYFQVFNWTMFTLFFIGNFILLALI